jgi:N-acetylglucosamine-6-phosphate deacetylase
MSAASRLAAPVHERAGRLLLEGALVPGRVRFQGGRILSVERLPAAAPDAPVVAPGLIDLHVHGFGGRNPLTDLGGMARALAVRGTTAFLPTLFPDEPGRLGREAEGAWARRAEAEGGARVLGLHLEGPFVNPSKAGGLRPDRLCAPSPAALRALLGPRGAAARGIRQVTLAPELPGAQELVAELAREGVRVSLGHSAASARDAGRAAEGGARGATHLFNAMEGIHHRAATLASFALSDEALVAEVIGDLVHVGREALRLALRARGPLGLALVSDALEGAGGPEREFESHGRRCRVRDGAIWLVEDDPARPPRLTGAEACQLEAVRRLVRAGVTDLATALTAASESPARALGIADERGRLAAGAAADLVVLDGATLALREVWVGGEALAPAEALPRP